MRVGHIDRRWCVDKPGGGDFAGAARDIGHALRVENAVGQILFRYRGRAVQTIEIVFVGIPVRRHDIAAMKIDYGSRLRASRWMMGQNSVLDIKVPRLKILAVEPVSVDEMRDRLYQRR